LTKKNIADDWTRGFSEKEYKEQAIFDIDKISNSELTYLDKIRDICQKNDIEFVTTIAPFAPSIRKYNEEKFYASKLFFTDLTLKKNITLIDMSDNNITLQDSDFIDGYHFNNNGKRKFTLAFINKINGN